MVRLQRLLQPSSCCSRRHLEMYPEKLLLVSDLEEDES